MAANNITVAADEVAAHAVVMSANTVDTITFSGDYESVEVLILVSGGAPLYYTVDKTAPTVAGRHCYILPDAIGSYEVEVPGSGNTVVKLISAGTPTYSVTHSPR